MQAGRTPGLRIGHLGSDLLKIPENLFGSTHNKHRLTTPFSNHLLSRLDLADIYLYRRTGSLGLGTGNHDPTNGTAAPTAPAAPTTEVAAKEATPACIHAVIAHSVVSHQLLMACREAGMYYVKLSREKFAKW